MSIKGPTSLHTEDLDTYPTFLRSLTQHWFPILLHTPLPFVEVWAVPRKARPTNPAVFCYIFCPTSDDIFIHKTSWPEVRERDLIRFLQNTNNAQQTAKMCRVPVRHVQEVMKTLAINSEMIRFLACLCSKKGLRVLARFGSLEVLFFLSASCHWSSLVSPGGNVIEQLPPGDCLRLVAAQVEMRG